MENYPLTLDDELPIKALPDVKDWSENYAFVGYDFETRIGFCAYVGRWVKNPKVFREQLYLYLPDGTLLSHISMGIPANRDVITGGCLQFRCNEVGGRWTISFEGPMRHDTLDALMREPVKEGHPRSVKFEVTIDHDSPVWMFPRANNSTYGNFHYEQMGASKGSIDFDGRRHEFSAPTYRDHTRGPRNLAHYEGHIWLQLHFRGGPSFSTYHMWHNHDGKVDKILDLGTSVRPTALREASLVNSPRLLSLDNVQDEIKVQVSLEGKTIDLVGKPMATLLYSFTKDVEFLYGGVPSLAEFFSIEQPILFAGPDGPVSGYMQRSGPYQRSV